jgi:hypothetical protein
LPNDIAVWRLQLVAQIAGETRTLDGIGLRCDLAIVVDILFGEVLRPIRHRLTTG